jgi:hypothetical protein
MLIALRPSRPQREQENFDRSHPHWGECDFHRQVGLEMMIACFEEPSRRLHPLHQRPQSPRQRVADFQA